MTARILIIDDERTITFALKKLLSQEGYEVSTANDVNEAGTMLAEADFDMIITDIIMGGNTGIDVLREIKKRKLNCPTVFITGYPNVETASEAVRLGAYDYLPKPVKNDVLLRTVKRALQHKALVDENVKYRANLEAIFKSIKDAIITVDRDLVVLELNKAAEDICGFPDSKEAKGKKYESLLKGCSGKCLDALIETIDTKLPAERSRIECNNQGVPGRVVDVTTYPLFDLQEKFNGCVMVMRDETRLAELESDLHERQQFHNIIGKSEKLQKIYSFIEALGNTQTTVLITGESGTGKGLLAEALHYHVKDSKKPFVWVDCASLSDNLLESELFGHVKGAFTGAVSGRVGRFQKADGGTIFLDEIGDISNKMQLRLLRVLQEMEFERVGDSTPIKVNVRVIAATNQDLRKKVRLGKFREDLYHRLKVVELTMPPLRDIREDIPLLVNHFIERLNKQFSKNIKSLSADVQKLFMDYKWPGNIRELYHVLEYAFVLCNKPVITIDNLSPDFKNVSITNIQPLERKKRNDQQAIVQALEKTGWNKAKAARLLGIGRRTLYLKIEKYNITENRVN
jgi:two-component system, NtrC family, response regulator HydG